MQKSHNLLPPLLPQAVMLSPPNSSLAPLQMSGHYVHMNVGYNNHAISLAAKNDIRLPDARGTFHYHNP
jgi:hypothetical protein